MTTIRIILAGMPKMLQEIVMNAIPEGWGIEIVGRTRSLCAARAMLAHTPADVIVVDGGLDAAVEAVCGQAHMPAVIAVSAATDMIVGYTWTARGVDHDGVTAPSLAAAIRAAAADGGTPPVSG